jgi:hypothetical protein
MRAAALLALALAACEALPSLSGLREPIRVREGTFHSGPLPSADDLSAPGPRVTAFENANAIVRWRQGGKALHGRATVDTYSIGIQLAGLGTGHWIVPVGAIDPTAMGERVWGMTLDLGSDIPLGLHPVELVAIDESSTAGPVASFPFCVVGDVPDNLNACDPTRPRPNAIISLTWDTDVDLDLVVQTPDGKTVDARHPTTAVPVNGRITPEALRAPNLGVLDRNSNADCHLDSIRRESLVWQGAPAPGIWSVYANLFSACGHGAVSFRVTVYRDGEVTQEASGNLLDLAANGGSQLGLHVLDVELP